MKWLEKGALFLMTGIMPVFIAACYGGPMDDDWEFTAMGSVKDKASGNPIGNILVRCLLFGAVEDETYTTAGDGSYVFDFYTGDDCNELQFEDIDGEENGGKYATKVIPFTEEADVEMELEE